MIDLSALNCNFKPLNRGHPAKMKYLPGSHDGVGLWDGLDINLICDKVNWFSQPKLLKAF